MGPVMVLIVDDHPDTAILLSKLLARAGVRAEFVTSGLDALGFLSRHVPRLVILDVMMPDMNGLDVLRAIREDAAYDAVKVMMYTADATYNRWQEALRNGAQAYLVKGTVHWDDLVTEVKRLL